MLWSALLGAIIGLIAIVYDITFRRVRRFFVTCPIPHVAQARDRRAGHRAMRPGFVSIYHGALIPIGPNYEAVREILVRPHPVADADRVCDFQSCRDHLLAWLRRG